MAESFVDSWWHRATLRDIDRVRWRAVWRPWQHAWVTDVEWASYSATVWEPLPAFVTEHQPTESQVVGYVEELVARAERGVTIYGESIAEQRHRQRMLDIGYIRNSDGSWTTGRKRGQ